MFEIIERIKGGEGVRKSVCATIVGLDIIIHIMH